MTTYKELKGTNIEVNSSDPSNPLEGQVWFNSTSNVLKGQRPNLSGSWATGGNLNDSRNGVAGAGTGNTAALAFGGDSNGGGSATTNTESWNGSNWTEVNNLNTARYGIDGLGTYTAALAVGGQGSLTGEGPPAAKAAVDVPIPAKVSLAVFKLFTSVQLLPS